MSSLHQLAVGLNITEKTLYSWNKNFGIKPIVNEEGDLAYTPEQKEMILQIYRLIKEQGLTIVAAKATLKKGALLEKRTETIEKLLEIKAFLKSIQIRL